MSSGNILKLNVSRHDCVFGHTLITSMDNKLCGVEIGEDLNILYANVYKKWFKHVISTNVTDNDLITKVLLAINSNIINNDIPLMLVGSCFQQKVWAILQQIKCGETMSYKDIAKEIESPNAVRAVGSACKNNPIAVIIPCHRVLRSNKTIGGYRWGLKIREQLINREMAM